MVIRYFGGTKLGKSGLIEAYGKSVHQTIEIAELSTIITCYWFQIIYQYPEENVIQKLKQDFELYEQDAEYFQQITLTVAVPLKLSGSFEKRLKELEHLSISFKKLEPGYYFS